MKIPVFGPSDSSERRIFVKRSDSEKSWRPIELYVDYFMLNYKDSKIYHYDVDIFDANEENTKGQTLMSRGRTFVKDVKNTAQGKRNIGKEKCCRVILEIIKFKSLQKFRPVYDGQNNLYTNQQLPSKEAISFPVHVLVGGELKYFLVSIKPVKKDGTNMISLEYLKNFYTKDSTEIPYEVLSVYEMVLNRNDPPFKQILYRNLPFSFQRENTLRLRCGLEICFGYYQSISLTELGPVVVLNTKDKAFHKAGPVIENINDILMQKHGPSRFNEVTKIPRLEKEDISEISEVLKGVWVRAIHQRQLRKYRITSLTEQSANELTFKDDVGKTIPVAEYF